MNGSLNWIIGSLPPAVLIFGFLKFRFFLTLVTQSTDPHGVCVFFGVGIQKGSPSVRLRVELGDGLLLRGAVAVPEGRRVPAALPAGEVAVDPARPQRLRQRLPLVLLIRLQSHVEMGPPGVIARGTLVLLLKDSVEGDAAGRDRSWHSGAAP